jgi:hypothetical protein
MDPAARLPAVRDSVMTAHQTVRRRRYSPWVVSWAATATRKAGSHRFTSLAAALDYARGPRIAARNPLVEHVDRAAWRTAYDVTTGKAVA